MHFPQNFSYLIRVFLFSWLRHRKSKSACQGGVFWCSCLFVSSRLREPQLGSCLCVYVFNMNRHIFVFAYWEPRHSEGVLYDMEVKRNACHHPPGAGICSARSPSFIAARASPPHKFPLPRNQAQFHTKRLGKHANFRLYRARTPFCMLITFRHTSRCSKNSTRRRLKAKTCVNVTCEAHTSNF